MAGSLLLRADAGSEVGTGHVMRALALADAWRAAGGRATLVSHCPVPRLRDRLQAAGFGLVFLEHHHPDPTDLAAVRALLAKEKSGRVRSVPTWVVLDGYHFDSAYQQAVRAAAGRLLVIDDLAHLDRYHGDVLLNQNLGTGRSDSMDYRCDADTILLLGSRYALLRPEFRAWESFRRETPEAVRRLLVTFGGADPGNVTRKVIAALGRLDLPRLNVKVMVGAANPHLKVLRGQVRRGCPKVQLLTDVADVPGLMAWAEMAVGAAGSTCWELAFMQLPAVVLVARGNQKPVAAAVAAAGAATSLGPADPLTAEAVAEALSALGRDRSRRASQSLAGRRLVDGRGAERVVAVMEALEGRLPSDRLRLRPAGPGDVLPLWRLANDPGVRRARLLSAEPVPLEGHLGWYQQQLSSPDCCMWVLDFHGLIVAQIRYDRADAETAEISLSVVPAFRQRGLATELIELTWGRACEQLGVRRVRAVVRQENLPSARTFARAGFSKVDFRLVRNHPCHLFEREKAAGRAATGDRCL